MKDKMDLHLIPDDLAYESCPEVFDRLHHSPNSLVASTVGLRRRRAPYSFTRSPIGTAWHDQGSQIVYSAKDL